MKSKLLSSASVIFLKLPFYTQAHEKSQFAYFRRFKRQFTRIPVYKVLYHPKDQGKSLDPMIPSKGLQAYGKGHNCL